MSSRSPGLTGGSTAGSIPGNKNFCYSFLLLFLFGQLNICAFEFSGYLKDLRSHAFTNWDSISTYGLLHNRLNFSVQPHASLEGVVEIRNRVFYGETLGSGGLSRALDQQNESIPLSATVVDKPVLLAHTEVDRAYIHWTARKLEARAGRQRINWGMATVWNPNDLFNTYDITDFDYEERPGTDGLKLEYFVSPMSSVQAAGNFEIDPDQLTAAMLFRTNWMDYDAQFLAGFYRNDAVLGLGWAGNVYNSGFKGEAAWFHQPDEFPSQLGSLNATVSVDYFFEKPVTVQGAFLYNSRGIEDGGSAASFLALSGPSPKNLMPTKYNFFTQGSWTSHPLVSLSMSCIYAAGVNGLFAMPSLSYSLAENWDLSLLAQSIFAGRWETYRHLGSSVFARVKWSF